MAESARLARIDSYEYDNEKNPPFNYQAAFEEHLKSGNLWKILNFGDTTDKDITVEVKYADDPDAFISGSFRDNDRASDSKKAKLAEYSVRYEYKKWIPLVPDVLTKPIFVRKFLVVQEYEG